MTRARRVWISLILAAVGVAILVWQIRDIGLQKILAGLSAVGWGFLLVLAISLLRFCTRAGAWLTLLGEPVPFRRGVAAVIAGDAVGNLTFLSLLVSEPTKAMYLGNASGPARALAALTAETFFYTVSVAVYVMLGTAAMLLFFTLESPVIVAGQIALVAMAIVLVVAGWLAWQQPSVVATFLRRLSAGRLAALVDRVRQFELDAYGAAGGERRRLGVVALWETAFHLLSFAESWVTVWLLTQESLPLAAFVLDSFSRVANVVAKPIPLQLGVDQWGSGTVAQAVRLATSVGVNLSIVRTGRKIVFMAVGFILLATRGAEAARKNA
jgi:hypothetical protein